MHTDDPEDYGSPAWLVLVAVLVIAAISMIFGAGCRSCEPQIRYLPGEPVEVEVPVAVAPERLPRPELPKMETPDACDGDAEHWRECLEAIGSDFETLRLLLWWSLGIIDAHNAAVNAIERGAVGE